MQLVVKVKYQEALRRMTLPLNQDGSPPISLEMLTSQIRHLFNFSPNAHLAIAYTDEDGDVVTMADDVDLQDAIHQGLNPLRLDVSLAAPTLHPPRSVTSDGITQGWDSILDGLRALTDPTCPLMRFAQIPEAANSALSKPQLMEGFAQLGSVLDGLAGLLHRNATASGSNM